MIKLTDLEFKASGCCGTHRTAYHSRSDGVGVGVSEGDGGYEVTLYFASGGQMSRHLEQTAAQVEALLNA